MENETLRRACGRTFWKPLLPPRSLNCQQMSSSIICQDKIRRMATPYLFRIDYRCCYTGRSHPSREKQAGCQGGGSGGGCACVGYGRYYYLVPAQNHQPVIKPFRRRDAGAGSIVRHWQVRLAATLPVTANTQYIRGTYAARHRGCMYYFRTTIRPSFPATMRFCSRAVLGSVASKRQVQGARSTNACPSEGGAGTRARPC